MDNRLLVSILIIIGFTISQTNFVMAQPNQLNINNSVLIPPSNATDIELDSDDKRIILTWLKTNEKDITQSDQAAAFIIDKRDFLKAFGQLFGNLNITVNPIE